MWGMNNPNSVVSQMGDIGNTVLNVIGISPWGSQNPNDYKNTADAVPGAKPGIAQQIGQGVMPVGPEGFYSHAENVLNGTKQGLWRSEDLLNYLKAKGVKDEELKWTGLNNLINVPKTTRDEALQMVRSGPKVGEHILTDQSKYNQSSLKLPGPHSNYKEILLTHDHPDALDGHTMTKFTDSHWEEPNVVAHLRINERPTVEGGKALHADEYQSDWANNAKAGIRVQLSPHEEEEYTKLNKIMYDQTSDLSEQQYDRWIELRKKMQAPGGVADAPYIRGSWSDLAAKRHLMEAAKDPNITDVTWTTGKQQADRYSMDKHFDKIEYNPTTGDLRTYPKGGRSSNVQTYSGITPEDLPRYTGRELADKLTSTPKYMTGIEMNKFLGLKSEEEKAPYLYHKLEGSDLAFENVGKRQFYDKIMPQSMKRLTKQEPQQVSLPGRETLPSGRAVSERDISPTTQKVWGIKMTPELRDKILKEGFPLYSIGPMMTAHEMNKRSSSPLPPPMMVNH